MVDFAKFGNLIEQEQQITLDLLNLGQQEGLPSPLVSFALSWMAFNGWMSCVTEAEGDRDMVNELAGNGRLAAEFDALCQQDHLGDLVQRLAENWPVLDVKQIRGALGRNAFSEYDRDELLKLCRERGFKRTPDDWNPRRRPNWRQTLKAIYEVRNNLFHGAKSPESGRDQALAELSDRVLRRFIERSNCLEWA